jgi:hypothetical protein
MNLSNRFGFGDRENIEATLVRFTAEILGFEVQAQQAGSHGAIVDKHPLRKRIEVLTVGIDLVVQTLLLYPQLTSIRTWGVLQRKEKPLREEEAGEDYLFSPLIFQKLGAAPIPSAGLGTYC